MTRLLLFAISVAFLFACHQPQKAGIARLTFTLDSVFINQYRGDTAKNFSDVPYIFFRYSVKNNSNSSIEINMRGWEYEAPTRDKAYMVYEKDTFQLWTGRRHVNGVIKPGAYGKAEVHPDPVQLHDVYDWIVVHDKGRKSLKPSEFLLDVAKSSTIFFNWNNDVAIDKGRYRKITFRDPSDSLFQIWK